MNVVVIMKIVLVGAGSDLGVSKDGARYGASTIINEINSDVAKVIYNQDETIIKSFDKNDLKKNLKELNKYNKKLYDIELSLKRNDSFVITIGGDHSIAIPSVLTSCKKYQNIGLLWIDAHPDFNTFETTITCNLHGLPCAAINNYKCDKLTNFHKSHFIHPKNTVIIGARSIDKGEKENLKKAGVTIITTEEIKKYGIKKIMEKSLSIVLDGVNNFHTSFDLDVIGPKECPGVSVPEKNGLSVKEVMDIIDYLLKYKDELVSFDVVEYNPLFDIDNKTKNVALDVLNKVIEIVKNK